MQNLPSMWAGIHFSFFHFYETRLRPSGCKRMQITGWCRVPKLRAQDYTLRDEIPGHKKRKIEGKMMKQKERKREKERGDRIVDFDAADINNATCVSGFWNLDASAQRLPPFSSYLTRMHFIMLATSAMEKGSFSFVLERGRERRDESLKNLINGTPVIYRAKSRESRW